MTSSSTALRQVPFPPYLEYQAARTLPLAARVSFMAALFVPVYIALDAVNTGGAEPFGALLVARLATLALGLAGGLIAWFGRRPGPSLAGIIVFGALSQNCATGTEVFLLRQIETVVPTLVFYFLAFVVLTPVLSRTAGIPVSDARAGQLFEFVGPCLAFIGLMMEHLRAAAVEAYRHARSDHLHLCLDALSQLLNRPTWMARAEARWRREGAGAGTVLMVDIDHFKAVNDTHGHDAGDRVIEAVARDVAERIRAGVAALTPESGPVTVSVGVAEAAPSLDEAVKAADRRLYQAKASGRNRVCGPGE